MKQVINQQDRYKQQQSPNLRRRILSPLILAICLLQGSFLATFYHHQKQRIQESQQTTVQRVKDLFHEEIARDVLTMNAALDVLIRDSQFLNLFKKRDRDALRTQAKPLYDRLRQQNQITHFYFHQPDRINFLRVHKDTFGDRINRITLQRAEQTGKPNAGLEQGPTGNPVLRSVYPWRSDFPERTDSDLFANPGQGELVGYVELGVEFQDIAQKVHKILDVDLVLAMDKQFLQQKEWENRNKKLGYQSDWNDFPGYVIVDKTVTNLPKLVNQEISKANPKTTLTLTFKDGGRSKQMTFLPLNDIDGRNLGHIVILSDISNIEQAAQESMLLVSLFSLIVGSALVGLFYIFLGRVEDNILERNAQLTQAEVEKLQMQQAKESANLANQAKSEFLANMSHELRTPLNGIIGYAQILSRSKALPDKERHGVNIIHQCGTHLLTLINDILDLSKIEARKLELTPKALHLPSLLQGVVEICRIRAEQKGINFIYQPDANLPAGIYTDEKRLRQVLINLIGNAIKFTDKGSVTLKVEIVEAKSDSNLSTIKFQVEDTGVGISATDLSKLFQAFEQVGDRKRQAEGTGLGLTISQQIVQLMGGQIQVTSQPGVGSNFYFELALAIAQDWAQQSTSSNGKTIVGYKGERRRLLVVDDRWENRGVLVNLLQPLGFDVSEAENGQQGIEQIAAFQPDLVITDLVMPVMDGFEMLKKVRQSPSLQHHKIIVSSASVTQMDRQMAVDAGGNDFLPKPVDAEELFKLLANHLYLEWDYEASPMEPGRSSEPTYDSNTLAIPSTDILQSLLKLTQQGKLRKLREQVENLTKDDVSYTGFSTSIITLAKQYKADEIETFLNQYLTQANNHE